MLSQGGDKWQTNIVCSSSTNYDACCLIQLQDYAVILLDVEGRIVAWLSNAERIFGYSETEALGKPVATLFTPEDVRMGMPNYERLSATQKGSRADNDRWMLRKDGLRFGPRAR